MYFCTSDLIAMMPISIGLVMAFNKFVLLLPTGDLIVVC